MALLLEVIVTSVADAKEAAGGGAGRLEVVRDLAYGGLTPSTDLVREIRRAVPIPLRVMLRDRDDYSAGGAHAVARLVRQAEALGGAGADGLVLGFVEDRRIDAAVLDRIANAVPQLPMTFHHAFDALRDAHAALETLKRQPQVDRVLTAGGAGSWVDKVDRLAVLAQDAAPQVTVLVGGGLNEESIGLLARVPELREAHVGRAARVPPTVEGRVSAARVGDLVRAARGEETTA